MTFANNKPHVHSSPGSQPSPQTPPNTNTTTTAPVIPVHGADSIELLDGEHGAEVGGDLLQALLVLLVDDEELHGLADVRQGLPGLAHPAAPGAADPDLHLGQPGLDVLAVGEGAALAAQEELVEQLDVDEGEELLEQADDGRVVLYFALAPAVTGKALDALSGIELPQGSTVLWSNEVLP